MIQKEVDVVQTKYYPVFLCRTEENNDKLQSRYPVAQPRIELNTSPIQVYRATIILPSCSVMKIT
jgi:hypothetical protein